MRSSRESALELDADRQAALQLRQEVGGLGHVEGARRDEQDVVGLHAAMLGGDGGALDQRQQVALHAFAADVGAQAMLAAAADLVDLVEEDDAVLLDRLERFGLHLLVVEQLVALLGDQHVVGIEHAHAARLGAPAEGLSQDLVQVDHAHAGAGHAGNLEGRQRGAAGVLHAELDLALVELAGAQHAAELGAGVGAGGLAHEGVDHALLGGHLGLGLDLAAQAARASC